MDSQQEPLPVMNPLNAPIEVCEAAKERFQQFLNEYQAAESAEAEPSQSQASQGSGRGREGTQAALRVWPAAGVAVQVTKAGVLL